MDRREFLQKLGMTAVAAGLPRQTGGQEIEQQTAPPLPLAEPKLSELISATPRLPSAKLKLFPIEESELKFSLDGMTHRLGGARYEGIMLTAYPDPLTKLPLIGAGFSLVLPPPRSIDDLPEPFTIGDKKHIEPAPQQLWEAAGLKPADFDKILDRFNQRLEGMGNYTYATSHSKSGHHGRGARHLPEIHKENKGALAANQYFLRRIDNKEFEQEISAEQSYALTRIAAFQAGYNAQFYCPKVFPEMTASQQEAVAHVLYQWGPHAMGLKNFIAKLNNPPKELAPQYWHEVQSALINDPKYKKYAGKHHNGRAVAVTAMFDPAYDYDTPHIAEEKVQLIMGGGLRGFLHHLAHPHGGGHHR